MKSNSKLDFVRLESDACRETSFALADFEPKRWNMRRDFARRRDQAE